MAYHVEHVEAKSALIERFRSFLAAVEAPFGHDSKMAAGAFFALPGTLKSP
jgi:hypothetical protein